jgi:hypothetical protein
MLLAIQSWQNKEALQWDEVEMERGRGLKMIINVSFLFSTLIFPEISFFKIERRKALYAMWLRIL